MKTGVQGVVIVIGDFFVYLLFNTINEKNIKIKSGDIFIILTEKNSSYKYIL